MIIIVIIKLDKNNSSNSHEHNRYDEIITKIN